MPRLGGWRLGRVMMPDRRFIAEVDGLRFVAIAAVVLVHINRYAGSYFMTEAISPGEAWISKTLDLGRYGVQLFFVLSGFLLALPFARWRLGLGSQPSLRAYYFRRLTRLEPPYVVSMLLLFVGGIVAFGADGLSRWPNLVASLLYAHGVVYGTESVINSVAWTLEVEVQFYLLAPFLSAVFLIGHNTLRRAAIAAAMLGMPLLRSGVALPPEAFSRLALSLPGHLEFFAAGFLLADLFVVEWNERPLRSLAWDMASVAGWALMGVILWQGATPVLIAPLMLVAYVGAFRGSASSWLLSRGALVTIGGMCYSIYLLHYPTISLVGRVLKPVVIGSHFASRVALAAMLLVPAILIVTTVFFVLVERPCMDPRWPRKLLDWMTRAKRQALLRSYQA